MAGVEDDKAAVEFPSLDVGMQTLTQSARSNGAVCMEPYVQEAICEDFRRSFPSKVLLQIGQYRGKDCLECFPIGHCSGHKGDNLPTAVAIKDTQEEVKNDEL